MVKNFKLVFLVVLVLLTESNLIAQNNNLVDVFVAQTLSYRALEKEAPYEHEMALKNDFGFNYQRFVAKRILLGSGLGYSSMGYNAKITELDAGGSPTGSVITLTISRNFIEVPMLFGYAVKRTESKSIILDAGFVNQFLISDKTKHEGNENSGFNTEFSRKDLKDQGLKTYNIAFNLGVTINRTFNNNLNLRFSPFFKYGLLNMDNIHDYSIGLKVGIGYSF